MVGRNRCPVSRRAAARPTAGPGCGAFLLVANCAAGQRTGILIGRRVWARTGGSAGFAAVLAPAPSGMGMTCRLVHERR